MNDTTYPFQDAEGRLRYLSSVWQSTYVSNSGTISLHHEDAEGNGGVQEAKDSVSLHVILTHAKQQSKEQIVEMRTNCDKSSQQRF